MRVRSRGVLAFAGSFMLAATVLPAAAFAQTSSPTNNASARGDQWIHVRVENRENRGETVRVNVPIEMAAKVLPAINHDKLHHGKVRIDSAHMDDVDLRALLDAVRTAKDGEYVTVQNNDNNVRVAKNNGYLYVHVTDKSAHDGKSSATESKVEVKVPMKVVDALFSSGTDELDIVAALRALSATGDTELVSVKDRETTVRVWIDSKNVTD